MHHLNHTVQMNTAQNYAPLHFPATTIEPTDAQWPSFTDMIEHLQNLELTSMAIARRDPANYHLLRSAEVLKQEFLDSLERLHPEWLELIGYPQYEAYRPDLAQAQPMVRFEPGKLVVEIPTADTYHEYLMILHALSTIGWFTAQHDEDDSIRNAYGVLSFYIGQSLTKMSETDMYKLNQAVTKP